MKMYLDRVQNLDHAGVAQGAQLLESVFREGQPGPVCGDVEGEDAAIRAVLLWCMSGACSPGARAVYLVHTRLVPLCRVHMDWSTSTTSPNEYGNAGPLAIADATADFRKSMAAKHPAWTGAVAGYP